MFILVVDNNRFYVSVLIEMLRKAGFTRIEDMDSGLNCDFQRFQGDVPDVIIMDESQCKIEGVDVLKKMRNSNIDSTVIILTDSVSPINVNVNPQKGSTICLSKDSITSDNLPKILYTIFSENINLPKKSPISKAFASFRKSFSGTLNF